MRTRLCCTVLALAALAGAARGLEGPTPDVFYQYSVWWAFVNRVFDGDLSVRTLKQRGDTGLGAFDFLDGELVLLDGIAYRVPEDGQVRVATDEDELSFANAAFFTEDLAFTLEGPLDATSFRNAIARRLPSPNNFYAFRIRGEFRAIKCGGVRRQTKPFEQGLDVLVPTRPVFEATGVRGTLVGIYCPPFVGNMSVAGFHFHFLTDDRKMGGHVMELSTAGPLAVSIDTLTTYRIELPKSRDFETVTFDKEFKY